MSVSIQEDLQQLAEILEAAKDAGAAYLKELPDRATTSHPGALNWPALPENGSGALNTLAQFKNLFYPYIVASSGPRYWGFVTGGGTPAAILGDWLTSVFDQNAQLSTGIGDASALLEIQTGKLLLDLFGLPENFMGSFVTGATMANFTGLAVARQWAGQQLGQDIARDGLRVSIPVYSAAPHSSSLKALAMLGMGSANIEIIPTLPDREAMDVQALLEKLPADPNQPFILIASGGTVNSVDFDDLAAIAQLKQTRNCWIHIDAAFGAFAALSEKHAHLLNGWKLADSITVDFHKWLNVPYDSAMIFTRKEHAVYQVQSFQNSAAPYLGNPWEQFSYLNYVPENSRRFRALPVWFSLMAYGKAGYRELVENCITLANEFGSRLLETDYFRLLAPVRLNTVCFQPDPQKTNGLTIPELLNELNRDGLVFMTPSVYKGESCIRAALVNYRTTAKDIDIALTAIVKAVEKISNLKKASPL
ncbi:pyridoxal-dependent decarboxylase [Flavihumibacter sp. RY-1]|uniref:Pyridoxal-dependent decarboxylase n=1 Tax=Flavihumibacter fluminis TaxID=2909236 RepID=A0ABS9BCR1_9BACT|nr:pyridoxal-dependent decarboxylase [Flavihumibacter fluminis]MCF1713459.1 pyridoxal-dependent decarboxylase [Flavihumibacter fluminis]